MQGETPGELLLFLKMDLKKNQEAGRNKYIQCPLLLQPMGFFDIQKKINLLVEIQKGSEGLERQSGENLGRSSLGKTPGSCFIWENLYKI